MTKSEWQNLGRMPLDIKKREARIRKLEELLAEGPVTVSDTVASSMDAGNATILCNATVRGSDPHFIEKEFSLGKLKSELYQLNTTYKKQYAEALRVIEQRAKPKTAHCAA